MARPKRGQAARRDRAHSTPRESGSEEKVTTGQRGKASRSPEKRANAIASSSTSSQILSQESLAKLNAENEKTASSERVGHGARDKVAAGRVNKEKREHKSRKRRVVSGGVLESGGGAGGRGAKARRANGKRRYGLLCWLTLLIVVLLLVILIPVGVLVIGKKNKSSSGSTTSAAASSTGSSGPSVSNADVPIAARGSILDPTTWYTVQDFNTTYTNDTVGGLPVMGLNSTWDDTTKANDNVPALNQAWQYGTTPIRGVNVGGWLSVEPFITPSLFDSYDSALGIVDEWTLTSHLGPTAAATTLEKHYVTFVTKETFQDIQAAGFDHVRIPYSYWAITTYDDDPYVPKISWRYLLRGIEYARQCGLRVNLDLHAVPGSQNGWNHSGRQGTIGWLNGTDGDLNAQRSLDIINQVSQFFAQERYKNIVSIYGLVNEPRMTALPLDSVLNWTTSAHNIIRQNGVTAHIAFGDGFLGLAEWQGKLQSLDGMVLDAHQYVIFNTAQIAYNHQNKIQFACSGWTAQTNQSMNTATGFGPTICGEWSQADTDCAQYLNNVNVGSRWTGTMDTDDPTTQVLSPCCPANSGTCECDDANADPSQYSTVYKQWLQMFAEAQMTSFEYGWGWFYWTWETESAVQWSWKLGLAAGILPSKAYQRDFNCSQTVPDYSSSGLPENY